MADSQRDRDVIANAVCDAVSKGTTWDEARDEELRLESTRGKHGSSLPRRCARAVRSEIDVDESLMRAGWSPEERAEAREHRRKVRFAAPAERPALKRELDAVASRKQPWSNL